MDEYFDICNQILKKHQTKLAANGGYRYEQIKGIL